MPEQGVLTIADIVDIGIATRRRPQPARAWPAGTLIVSADSHWLEGDIWVDRFPAHLKDRAPRMRFEDGGWDLWTDGKPMYPPGAPRGLCEGFECVPGMSNVAARLKDLDREGVEKELLFPQRTIALYGDVQMRELFYDAYNEAIAEVCGQAPGRLYFVAIPNYWDPAKAAASLAKIKALGASALMVPITPKKDVDGEDIVWSSPKLDTFWSAVEASGLPLCFHIGENIRPDGQGGVGVQFLTLTQGFRPSWATLTFGGVFDRHPALKVVFVEAGVSWVPGMLQEADKVYHSFGDAVQPRLAHAPSWYWFNHCYATFMVDPAGLRLLDLIGPERVMWSSDYPHLESTFGYTSSAIGEVFKATDTKTAQAILGGTALKLFGMG